MNRIEAAMNRLQEKQEKAMITYMTAGLPSMEGTKELIKAQEEAGLDVLELGVPFSDPVADGPVIQDASYRSILKGTNLRGVLRAVKEVREEGSQVPIVFMMYYNTILHFGVGEFAKACAEAGVDGLIVPDLPLEEQGELREALDGTGGVTILIQLVSPVSKGRIPKILEGARGFVYCVSSMGVTGQDASFHKNVVNYLREVKEASGIPVMMGFGIRTAKDVEPMKEIIDGAIVGSHFIRLMEECGYDCEEAKRSFKTFKHDLYG